MASKKSAFFLFMDCHKKDMTERGLKPPSYDKLCYQLTSTWNSMTEDEKKKYKDLADEFNSAKKKIQPLKQIMNLQDNNKAYWNMHKYITNMIECVPNTEELLKKKFILIHINSHTHNEEQYYFPAEIAALEFNLLEGLSRTYHQLVGLSKIYPRGFAGSMRAYSDKFHQISCWEDHPNNYQDILLEFLTFLKNEEVKHTDLEGELELPYVYTIQTENYTDMMKTKSSLERLYSTAFPEVGAECHKTFFKVGSVERLLVEIKKKMDLHLDVRNFEGTSVNDILESDMYGHGLGCMYHELRNVAFKCSKARILQWMSNICKHISSFTGLLLEPGKHMAVQLNDGSRMMIENADVPLGKIDLKLSDMITTNNLITPLQSNHDSVATE